MSNPIGDFIDSASKVVMPPIQNFMKGLTESAEQFGGNNNAGMAETAGNYMSHAGIGDAGASVPGVAKAVGRVVPAAEDAIKAMPEFNPATDATRVMVHPDDIAPIKNALAIVNSGNIGDAGPGIQKMVDIMGPTYLDKASNLQGLSLKQKLQALSDLVDFQAKNGPKK